jgi:hypothetical protein
MTITAAHVAKPNWIANAGNKVFSAQITSQGPMARRNRIRTIPTTIFNTSRIFDLLDFLLAFQLS